MSNSDHRTDHCSNDIEREKTKSFELGHISQLEDVSEELRERSGEKWAEADSRKEIAKARQLKELAQEFEERAETKREAWEDEYKNRSRQPGMEDDQDV